MSQFEAKVVELLSEETCINKEEINSNTHLDMDLDLDSLSLLNVVIELESEYKIEIRQDDYLDFKTVKDITNYLEAKVTNEQTT